MFQDFLKKGGAGVDIRSITDRADTACSASLLVVFRGRIYIYKRPLRISVLHLFNPILCTSLPYSSAGLLFLLLPPSKE